MVKDRQYKEHFGKIIDSVNGFDVIDCKVCGFKHIVPIPTQEELTITYKEDYYSTQKPMYLKQHSEDLEWWNLVYSERYDRFEENLSLERRRILDVGSGPGFFLLHGKNRGWQTVGIEPSIQAFKHSCSLDLTVKNEFLTENNAKKLGLFDVVHLSEVMEHIPNPKSMVNIIRNILTPNGLICVIVPNDYNPIQEALRSVCGFDPWWVAPPHHINYFNFTSMERLLRSEGFEIMHCESTFPIDIFLLMGDNYVGNESLGRQCHKKRKTLELNLLKAGISGVKRNLYRDFVKYGIGRECLFICKKVFEEG